MLDLSGGSPITDRGNEQCKYQANSVQVLTSRPACSLLVASLRALCSSQSCASDRSLLQTAEAGRSPTFRGLTFASSRSIHAALRGQPPPVQAGCAGGLRRRATARTLRAGRKFGFRHTLSKSPTFLKAVQRRGSSRVSETGSLQILALLAFHGLLLELHVEAPGPGAQALWAEPDSIQDQNLIV